MLYQLSYSRRLCGFKKYCGESRIRTYEGESQQIYSLPQLTALVSPLCHNNKKRTTPTLPCSRAGGGTRTLDLLITNQLLYQLSYAGKAPSSQGLLPKIHLKRRCKGRSFILTNQTFGAKFYSEPPQAPSCGSFNKLFATRWTIVSICFIYCYLVYFSQSQKKIPRSYFLWPP